MYSRESPIFTVKQTASFKQYQAAYAGGHLYVWNVIFGLGVGVGGRGFGVVRLEHASANGVKVTINKLVEKKKIGLSIYIDVKVTKMSSFNRYKSTSCTISCNF